MGLLLGQQQIDRAIHLGQSGAIQRRHRIYRRKAGARQQRIPFTKIQLEHLRQSQHHLAARLGFARFKTA